jgi:Fe-S cluster assembly iron-binding protein IscA
MLAITADAATAIRGIVEASDMPEESGLRISAEPTEEGHALHLAIVPEPELADEVVSGEGTQVFLEPVAADVLDDKVLDAEISSEQISFTIVPQEPSVAEPGRNSSGPH